MEKPLPKRELRSNLYLEPHLHSSISSESPIDRNYDTRDER